MGHPAEQSIRSPYNKVHSSDDFFAPHITLPEQAVRNRHDRAIGEQRLMYGQFARAFHDLSDSIRLSVHHAARAVRLREAARAKRAAQDLTGAKRISQEADKSSTLSHQHLRIGDEALDWMKSESAARPYDFEIVCHWVGAAASRLRPLVVEAYQKRDLVQLAKFAKIADELENTFRNGG